MGSIGLVTRQREVARYYVSTVGRAVPLTGTVTTREEAAGSQSAFRVRVDSAADRRSLLNHFAMLYPEGITYELLGGDEGAAAFVGGAFLACGSLADPERKYHLEFAVPRAEAAPVLTGILEEVGFQPKVASRRGLPLIYTHDSEQMEDLLTFMSCPRMSLEVMNVKILKERRNVANRAANCDSANIDKTVAAAAEQIADIRLIAEKKIKKEKPLPEITEDEKTCDIPEGWMWCRLGEIVTVLGGKRIPAGRQLTTENTGYKYIRVSDMKDGTVLTEGLLYVPSDIFPSIARYIIHKEDIYITVAGTIGRVGKIPEEIDGANLTENADRLVFSMLEQNWLIKC